MDILFRGKFRGLFVGNGEAHGKQMEKEMEHGTLRVYGKLASVRIGKLDPCLRA